jgi:hypothetical protein
MGIKVKHSPSAATIGGTAYTIGRGQKKRWATEIGLKQQGLNLQAMSIGAQAQARMAAIKQRDDELEFRKQQQEAGEERWQDEFDFRKQQQKERIGLELQKSLEEKKRLDEADAVWGYAPEQIKQLERLDRLRSKLRSLVAKGEWLPEQAEAGEMQIDRLQAGILPQRMRKSQMSPQEMLRANTVTLTTGEQVWVDPQTGKPTPLRTSHEKLSKQYDESYKILTDANGIPPSIEELKKYLKEKEAFIAELQGKPAQAEEIDFRKKAIQEKRDKEQAAVEEAKEDLQLMFDAVVKGKLVEPTVKPSKGLKRRPVDFKGAPAGMTYPYKHKFYGEEKYKESLNKAIERGKTEGVTPEEIKVEFDKWWDSQDKELFGDRMEFEGAAQGATAFPKGATAFPKGATAFPKGATAFPKGATAFPKREGEELGDVPQPKTKAEYDKLKPGTRYIDPDGVERIKR